jgi:8-oxo-dGTP diphosphatase
MRGDGNGWSIGLGGRYWGRFGAAGLLLRAPLDGGSRPAVLMQHRAVWSHQGGTWALPGGARDSHESTVDAALREAAEEAGLDPATLVVRAERITAVTDSGWTYTTVVADAPSLLRTERNRESEELRWVPEEHVHQLPLHPAFAESWPALRAVPTRSPAEEGLPRTEDRGDAGFAWLY